MAAKKKSSKKRGNPPFKATATQRVQVKALRLANVPSDLIADIVGCSRATLYRYFKSEIEHTAALNTARVATVMYSAALKAANDPKYQTSAIFWLKAHGWKETSGLEVSGPSGEPITIENAGAKDLLREKLKTRVERQATEIIEAAESD
jgi:AcrR family transcriptional regulator|tara:strand:+ start:854 stop:1300 length:447 start_codon:yes stop_codon:yes gene_type:complete